MEVLRYVRSIGHQGIAARSHHDWDGRRRVFRSMHCGVPIYEDQVDVVSTSSAASRASKSLYPPQICTRTGHSDVGVSKLDHPLTKRLEQRRIPRGGRQHTDAPNLAGMLGERGTRCADQPNCSGGDERAPVHHDPPCSARPALRLRCLACNPSTGLFLFLAQVQLNCPRATLRSIARRARKSNAPTRRRD